MRQVRLLYTNITQVLWQVHLPDKLINFLDGNLASSFGAPACEDNPHCIGGLGKLRCSCIQVEAHCMWQDDAIGYAMWYTSRATQNMTEAVVQCHCDVGECRSGQKCSSEHLAASLQIIPNAVATWQSRSDMAYTTDGCGRGE